MSQAFPDLASMAPATGAANDAVIDTTTQAFAKDVIEESRKRPVLVDFWAPWCGPCRTLSPVIEKAVKATKGGVRLVKMNIDDHPSIAGQLGIQSIPAVIAFSNGQPIDGFIGALPESQVKAFIDRVAGPAKEPGDADLVARAEAMLANGDAEMAAAVFGEALKANPESIPASAGLARSLLALGEIDQARQTLQMLPDSARADARIAAVAAQLALSEQAASLGDQGALEAKLAANPADHQARLDLALLLNARGEREAAVDHLLEIMRRDRNWEEEKARKQLLQFFEAWGPMDEAARSGRRKLSSMLFA